MNLLSKSLSWNNRLIFILFYLVSKFILEFKNFSLSPDISAQLASLHNFSNGNGFTIAFFENGVLTYSLYNYNSVGLSLILYPLNLVLNNTILSAFTINLISQVFFIWFLVKLLDILVINNATQSKTILIFAFIQSPYVYHWPADALAMVTALWCVYFTLAGAIKRKDIFYTIAISLAGLSYLIKYSYLPFLFFPFCYYLMECVLSKNVNWNFLKRLLIYTFISGFCFYLTNFNIVGQRAGDVNLSGNIYLKNLLSTDGFLFHIGIYEHVIENSFGPELSFTTISKIITFGILTICVFNFIKIHKNELKILDQKLLQALLLCSFLFLGFLMSLSISNPYIIIDNKPWTYVENTRYYSPVIILGLLFMSLLFLKYFYNHTYKILFGFFLLLNILSYRSLIICGNYGRDLSTYLEIQKNLKSIRNLDTEKAIIYYEPNTIHDDYFYLLRSSGFVLVCDSVKDSKNYHLKGYYSFKLKSNNSIGLIR
jgi:hypothetical protein